MIKTIASEAASDLERALGRTVKLFLYDKANYITGTFNVNQIK